VGGRLWLGPCPRRLSTSFFEDFFTVSGSDFHARSHPPYVFGLFVDHAAEYAAACTDSVFYISTDGDGAQSRRATYDGGVVGVVDTTTAQLQGRTGAGTAAGGLVSTTAGVAAVGDSVFAADSAQEWR
jgi:hypothetical protein